MSRNRMGRIAALAGLTFAVVAGCNYPVDRAANKAFLSSLGSTSITVFPVFLRNRNEAGYDTDAATGIGTCFTDNGLATVTVSDEEIPITGSWHADQSKMFSESIAEFADYVVANPIESEYAVLAEYLKGGRGEYGGIHCYIVDAQARVAWCQLWNSHWEAFAEASPDTAADCTAMLTQELAELLTPAESGP
jgi:hypothetical protein